MSIRQLATETLMELLKKAKQRGDTKAIGEITEELEKATGKSYTSAKSLIDKDNTDFQLSGELKNPPALMSKDRSLEEIKDNGPSTEEFGYTGHEADTGPTINQPERTGLKSLTTGTNSRNLPATYKKGELETIDIEKREKGEMPRLTNKSKVGLSSLLGAGALASDSAGTRQEETSPETIESSEEVPTDTKTSEAQEEKTSTSEAEKPKALSKLAAGYKDTLNSLGSRINDLAKNKPSPYTSKLQESLEEINTEWKAFDKTYKKNKNKVEMAEIAETIGHALAQLGAGMQGMRSGLDVSSNVKFSKVDWSKKMDRLLDELKQERANLEGKRELAVGQDAAGRKDAQRQSERYEDKLMRLQDEKDRASVGKARAEEDFDKFQKREERLTESAAADREYKKAILAAKASGNKDAAKSAATKMRNFNSAKTILLSIDDFKGSAKNTKLLKAKDLLAKAGYTPEIVDEMFVDKSGWWDSERSPEEVLKLLNEMGTPELATTKEPEAPTPLKSTIPKVGEERNGYIFKGGDPKDSANWKKKD